MIGDRGWQTHKVDPEHFQALVEGAGDERAIAALWASERSWRLLALRDLIDACATVDGVAGPLPSVDMAWQLLTEASKSSPATTEEVLAQPQVGIWVAHTLRRLVTAASQGHDEPPDLPPLWADVGYLHALAAASAVRAGITFELDVPVRFGTAVLPTVGAAAVHAGRDVVRVSAAGGTVQVDGSATWHPPVRIEVTAGGVPVRIELVDRDVYRDLRGPSPPRPATGAEVEQWRATLGEAWELLVREQADRVGAIAATVRTITPLPHEERFRPLSASGAEAFGGMLLSEPDDALQLAVTLVHEVQHQKLGALLHLFTLFEDGRGLRGYAPWRDDPRPVGGLVQGVYAFAGITAFWRTHRAAAAAGPLAEFEFALWRRQTLRVLATLRGSAQLTDDGRTFVAALSDTVAALQHDRVSSSAEEAARRMANDHHALWRVANVVVGADVGPRLAAAWRRGGTPPADLLAESDTVLAGPPFGGFDARAVLLRHRLTDPAGFARLTAGMHPRPVVFGATAGDVALIAGDAELARREYRAYLDQDVADIRSLVGLGLALPEGDEATRALLGRPELVLAAGRHAPRQLLDLAAWLGRMLPEPGTAGRAQWHVAQP